jgi:hypothetical protein
VKQGWRLLARVDHRNGLFGAAPVQITAAIGPRSSHVRPEVFFLGQAVVSCQSRASSLAFSACAGSRQLTTGSALLST